MKGGQEGGGVSPFWAEVFGKRQSWPLYKEVVKQAPVAPAWALSDHPGALKGWLGLAWIGAKGAELGPLFSPNAREPG